MRFRGCEQQVLCCLRCFSTCFARIRWLKGLILHGAKSLLQALKCPESFPLCHKDGDCATCSVFGMSFGAEVLEECKSGCAA